MATVDFWPLSEKLLVGHRSLHCKGLTVGPCGAAHKWDHFSDKTVEFSFSPFLTLLLPTPPTLGHYSCPQSLPSGDLAS